ncbi:MAG: arylsulfatase [Planctomycetes bacterium]|nr:arylsulfatase [Planctomycetota bacterium]
MTDDQGYGDMSAHGNPILKTPEMDKIHAQSVRFTDFHVSPKCTPTRGSLMTGLDPMRNGATHVCQGLSMMNREVKIMPQYFAESGYATGLFGKWHLGDSYPHQPRFRGFQEVLSFRAWGITSLADYWGNTYFNPMLMHNGVDEKYEGYCTDIFFDEAMKWMSSCKDQGKPFFVYLPTNTPHYPNVCPKKFSDPYKGKKHKGLLAHAEFYGMISNIDENMGRLENFLKEKDLRDNTILLFLSDNGSQSVKAAKLYNAGMKSHKGSIYEGGHRVHLFVRWIDGQLSHGKDISDLTIVQDILPTLVELCGLKDKKNQHDGRSFAELLKGKKESLEERISVIQAFNNAKKWSHALVMKDKWRLMRHKGGNELYDISLDPHQDQNVYDQFPEVVKELSSHYDLWYKGTAKAWHDPRYIIIGSEYQNPLNLYSNDWIGDYCDHAGNLGQAKAKGFWHIQVEREGEYEIELRRWPEESQKTLVEAWAPNKPKTARPIAKASLKVADFEKAVAINAEDTHAQFTVRLKKGQTKLETRFFDEHGKVLGSAIYVKVTRK